MKWHKTHQPINQSESMYTKQWNTMTSQCYLWLTAWLPLLKVIYDSCPQDNLHFQISLSLVPVLGDVSVMSYPGGTETQVVSVTQSGPTDPTMVPGAGNPVPTHTARWCWSLRCLQEACKVRCRQGGGTKSKLWSDDLFYSEVAEMASMPRVGTHMTGIAPLSVSL